MIRRSQHKQLSKDFRKRMAFEFGSKTGKLKKKHINRMKHV